MECGEKLLSFSKTRQKEEETLSMSFMQNGSALLEELIITFNGRHKIPIRSFTAEELIGATNKFTERVKKSRYSDMFRGSLEQQPVLVTMMTWQMSPIHYSIHDIVISSQMSRHKNVLKLLGCCLEFESPALVYEYAGTHEQLLSELLYDHPNEDNSSGRSLITWAGRLRIASGIASAILYLHTVFPTPIVYRDLNPRNVIIDQNGVAKLFNFASSIALPPGELQVEANIKGYAGFVDPEYRNSRFVTQKVDVYSLGVLLLVLLTGMNPSLRDHEGNLPDIVNNVIASVNEDKFNEIVDPIIMGEGGGIGQGQQLQAVLQLALKCVQTKGEDRPEMIDVAREIRQIERGARPTN